MAFNLIALPWLPDAAPDFRQQCKALAAETPGLGQKLATLATAQLTSTQALTFSRTLARLAEADLAPLVPFPVAVLASFTAEMIVDTLPAACARHGVAVQPKLADFDQIVQTLSDPNAACFAHGPKAALLLFDHRWLGLDRFVDTEAAHGRVAAAIGQVQHCIRLARERGVQPIVTTLAVPPEPLLGSFDRLSPGTVRSQVLAFNQALGAMVLEEGSTLFDVAALAEQVGTASWFDPTGWNGHKAPFWSAITPLYADALGRLIGALAGRSRKCLVLDCDNTLWGGVIGDDGLAGIRIGPGSGEGESFSALQHYALDLKRRGIILAVSSKNDDATARAVFRDHPDMVLREGDIAVFQANWSDKATNLEAIAKALDIGLDSLVFLDDNAAERAQMRAALPMVAVPELPGDPAEYVLHLASAGYFETLSFSQEDAGRSASYAANARRAEIREHSRDLGDYLTALEMVIDIRPFDTVRQARIVQLINKTNQFNLMTQRVTDTDIAAIMAQDEILTLQVSLADRFSDFGLIGVAVAGPDPDNADALDISHWLMSCRVLGRKVEEAMLAHLVAEAILRGKTSLHAHYRPTPKNAMVADLFDRLGLERTEEESDGSRHYRLDVTAYAPPDLPHQIRA